LVGNATAGDTLLNPLDAGCLYDMNKFHDWDCIHTDDGVSFVVDTTIEIGNCSTPTFFRDYGHDFAFGGAHNFTLCPPAYLEISGGQTWTVTEKGQIRDALGVDGDKVKSVGGVLQKIKSVTDAIIAFVS